MWVLRSVSNPNESMAGMNAFTVYKGEPGTGASWVTWPLHVNKEKKVVANDYCRTAEVGYMDLKTGFKVSWGNLSRYYIPAM